MDTTNNPDMGTGSATETTSEADTFKALLDSENATTDIEGTEQEADASITSEEDFEDDVEQPDEDSEGVEGDETEDAADEAEDPTEALPSDDLIVARDDNGNPITLKEIREGNLRQADYTKKMQEISALRKQWIVNEVNKQELRDEMRKQVTGLMTVIATELETEEPDWEALYREDPYEAQLKKFDWDKKHAAKINRLRQLNADRQALEEQSAQVAKEQARQRKIEAREQLAAQMPEAFGEKTAKSTFGAIETFLVEQGVPEHMISEIDSAPIIMLAYKALQYERLQQQKAVAVKKVEAKPALTMPGNTTASKKPSGDALTNTIRKYQRTGSNEDATAMFKSLLGE